MENLPNTPILDYSRSAKRCLIGYETLYQKTKLSFSALGCTSPVLESPYGYFDSGSDADDETTDLSGKSEEYLNSSGECHVTPKDYFMCSGTGKKPLSLIIKKCDSPVSCTQTKICNNTSGDFKTSSYPTKLKNGVLCREQELLTIHDSPLSLENKKISERTEDKSSSQEDNSYVKFQEGVISSSQDSSNALNTQECIENVLDENELPSVTHFQQENKLSQSGIEKSNFSSPHNREAYMDVQTEPGKEIEEQFETCSEIQELRVKLPPVKVGREDMSNSSSGDEMQLPNTVLISRTLSSNENTDSNALKNNCQLQGPAVNIDDFQQNLVYSSKASEDIKSRLTLKSTHITFGDNVVVEESDLVSSKNDNRCNQEQQIALKISSGVKEISSQKSFPNKDTINVGIASQNEGLITLLHPGQENNLVNTDKREINGIRSVIKICSDVPCGDSAAFLSRHVDRKNKSVQQITKKSAEHSEDENASSYISYGNTENIDHTSSNKQSITDIAEEAYFKKVGNVVVNPITSPKNILDCTSDNGLNEDERKSEPTVNNKPYPESTTSKSAIFEYTSSYSLVTKENTIETELHETSESSNSTSKILKETQMKIVAIENMVDTMSPLLVVPAIHFESFEETYDNLYREKSLENNSPVINLPCEEEEKSRFRVDVLNLMDTAVDYTGTHFQHVKAEEPEEETTVINAKISPIEKHLSILEAEIFENRIKVPVIQNTELITEDCNPEVHNNETHTNFPDTVNSMLELFGNEAIVSSDTIGICKSSKDEQESDSSQAITAASASDTNSQMPFKIAFLNDELTTQSSISLSPKNPILTTGMDEIENSGEIINDQYLPVNTETSSALEEDTVNFAGSKSQSGLLDNMLDTRSSLTNTTDDQLNNAAKTDNNSFVAQTFTEDALDCPYNEMSSDAAFMDRSPLLFSSDEENSYFTDTLPAPIKFKQEMPAEEKQPNKYKDILSSEQKKLSRLQEDLMGVPPPPKVTVPTIELVDILRLWKENEKLIATPDLENSNVKETTRSSKVLLRLSSSLAQIKNTAWPEIKLCSFHGIHYNYGRASEEFESLCQKLQDRYVGCETLSSCNIWFTHDVSNKINSMTAKRKSTGHSPGRRLSHLARRRQTFSSANLLNKATGQLDSSKSSCTSTAERRHIMVEIKKNDRRHKSKNNQLQKQVPSADTARLQQTKRALFKSPPSGHKRIHSVSKSRSSTKKHRHDIDRQRVLSSKRALWPSASNEIKSKREYDRALTNISGHINVYGKRRREDNDAERITKLPRRTLFSERNDKDKRLYTERDVMDKSKKVKNGENRRHASIREHSAAKESSGNLNERHKKKLLWAVAEALRAEGIGMSHDLFRPCASTLGCLVRSLLPDLNSKRKESTTDLMLRLCKEHIKDVIKRKTADRKLLKL